MGPIKELVSSLSISDTIAGMSLLVAIFSLLVTILGIFFAWRAYKIQTSAIEPWKLEKVADDFWILTRNKPKPATIQGILHNMDCNDYQLSWSIRADNPSGYFVKGTHIGILIKGVSPGVPFTLYYQEHRRKRSTQQFPYKGEIMPEDYDDIPKKWKKWSTYLY